MYVRCRTFARTGSLALPASCVCMYVYMARIAIISMVPFGRFFFSPPSVIAQGTSHSGLLLTGRKIFQVLTGKLYQTASRSGFGLVVAACRRVAFGDLSQSLHLVFIPSSWPAL